MSIYTTILNTIFMIITTNLKIYNDENISSEKAKILSRLFIFCGQHFKFLSQHFEILSQRFQILSQRFGEKEFPEKRQ